MTAYKIGEVLPSEKPIPQILRKSPVTRMVEGWTPKTALGLVVRRALPHLPESLAQELFDTIQRSVVMESELRGRVYRGLRLWQQGLIPWPEVVVEDEVVLSRRVVTDVGVAYIVDAFQNLTEVENFKYHALGTGAGAEAAANTTLSTELTTEYTGNVRATGSTTENAANIYETVGTNTLDSGTPSITEHGVFSASSAGTLLDKSLFTAIALNGTNGDGLQTTYRLTFASGG